MTATSENTWYYLWIFIDLQISKIQYDSLMNIVFYNFYYGYLTGGPRTLISILQNMDKSRFHSTFVTQDKNDLLKAVEEIPIEGLIKELPSVLNQKDGSLLKGSPIRKLIALLAVIKYNFSLIHVLKERKVSVIWTRGTRGVLLIGIASRLCKIPLVWDIALEYEPKGMAKILQRLSLIIADVVIAESKAHYKFLFSEQTIKRNQHKLKYISSAIPRKQIDDILKTAVSKRNLNTPTRLLNVGIIGRRKNQLLAIKTVYALKSMGHEVLLNFVGPVEDKAYLNELKNYIELMDLKAQIFFHGWQENIAYFLSISDIFLFTSTSEGVPHVLKEAMFAKLPIVSTRAGEGVSEIIQNNHNGYVSTDYNEHTLANYIADLIKNVKNRMQMTETGYQFAQENFLPEKECRQYEEVFQNLAKKKK